MYSIEGLQSNPSASRTFFAKQRFAPERRGAAPQRHIITPFHIVPCAARAASGRRVADLYKNLCVDSRNAVSHKITHCFTELRETVQSKA